MTSEVLELKIKEVAKKFIELTKEKEILIVSHFDTDGITSATILIKTLKKLDKTFSVKILKRIEENTIEKIPTNKIIIFLDLASGSLSKIENSNLENIFIIDHHEVVQEIPKKIFMINPQLNGKEELSSSSLVYLFCRELNENIQDLARLAILGMIGDSMEKSIDKLNNFIINDGDLKKMRGLLLYPSTRPINRVLEYCSDPFIPEITGNQIGVMEMLREIGLTPKNGRYKSLIELNEKEMSDLLTAVLLRNPRVKNKSIIGDIFLLKFFNKLEDARELSAKINACSRLGNTGAALEFCMENPNSKKRADSLHTKYRQHIVAGLKFASETEKIQGKGFVIINSKENIKDTMAGTIASILSNSSLYDAGTIIVVMSYYEDMIKVSARNVGREGRNIREILSRIIENIGGQVGGHKFAAGCMIKQEKEEEFIEHLKKVLEIEVVKV